MAARPHSLFSLILLQRTAGPWSSLAHPAWSQVSLWKIQSWGFERSAAGQCVGDCLQPGWVIASGHEKVMFSFRSHTKFTKPYSYHFVSFAFLQNLQVETLEGCECVQSSHEPLSAWPITTIYGKVAHGRLSNSIKNRQDTNWILH